MWILIWIYTTKKPNLINVTESDGFEEVKHLSACILS